MRVYVLCWNSYSKTLKGILLFTNCLAISVASLGSTHFLPDRLILRFKLPGKRCFTLVSLGGPLSKPFDLNVKTKPLDSNKFH